MKIRMMGAGYIDTCLHGPGAQHEPGSVIYNRELAVAAARRIARDDASSSTC